MKSRSSMRFVTATLLAASVSLALSGAGPIQLGSEPREPDPSTYGMDPATGKFKHPASTPAHEGPKKFNGSLTFHDKRTYVKNVAVEGYFPHVVFTGHSWPATMDMNGRRYMYHHYRRTLKVYDITNPKQLEVILDRSYPEGDNFGAAAIRFNKKLGKHIMIQSFEVPRFGIIENKYTDREGVKKVRNFNLLRGFKVFEMLSPTEWKELATVSTDPYHTAENVPQQGSGSLDIPAYFGDKYLFIAAAPDDSFANTEYKSVLYSPAQMAYDVSDPSHPRLLSAWWVPGQRLGEEEEYRKNPRAGNHTSWMGARMPVFLPRPVEEGGRYGYAAMGGFGFWVLDVSNPNRMRAVGHLDVPPSVAGTEGDNIDVSKVEATGVAYFSGYPLNEDCYEPYKDVYAIDVKDPVHPRIIATLPRPTPPPDAPFTDFCQRGGSFGPKRSGYYTQPGTPKPNILPYAFYNAGLQVFDVSDPAHATIAAYFVPPMLDEKISTDASNPTHGIYVEWDRNLIWVFTNHGLYLVSSPVLGQPAFGPPATE